MTQPIGRVTPSRAVERRAQLQSWHTPASMKLVLTDMAEAYGFFAASQGIPQYWREAYCGCDFAQALGAEAVRLPDTSSPGFELRSGSQAISCELVEIRDPRSPTGSIFGAVAEQYDPGRSAAIEPFDAEAHRRWLGERLSEAVIRKAAKGFDPRLVLAVYVHAKIFPERREDTERGLAAAVLPHLDAFPAIWVLASGRLLAFSVHGDKSNPSRA